MVASSTIQYQEYTCMFGKRKEPETPKLEPQAQSANSAGSGWKKWEKTIGAATTVFLIILTAVVTFLVNNTLGLPSKVAVLESQVSTIQETQEKQEKTLDGALETLQSIDKELALLSQRFDEKFPAVVAIPVSGTDFSSNITKTFYNKDNVMVKSASAVSMSYTAPIMLDVNTRVTYTAKDLVDEKLLVPYKNGEEDMFFYGKFNEKGNWDGHCIINVYKNGSLELVVDAEYDDGTLLHSKQVFHYVTIYSKIKQDVWAISDRTVENGYSSGYTNLYYRNGDFSQRFDPASMKEGDMISADQFYDMMDLELYAYYSGNTSDGYFNDNTGNAYLIYYNKEDNTVKTLYSGKFVDGTINDSTGNAWWITEDEETSDGRYGYYKGRFKDGDVASTKGYEYNISQDRIDQLLEESGKESLGLVWRQVGDNN